MPIGVAAAAAPNLAFGTAETTIQTSAPAKGIRVGQKVLIIAWITMTTGGTQTNTTLKIRRGSGIGGTEVSVSSVGEAIYAAAGSTEDHVIMAVDNAANDDPVYTFTGTTGVAAGTILQSAIVVLPIG